MSKTDEFLKKVEEKSLKGKDMLLFVDSIGELGQTNEDILDLLEDMKEEEENIILNVMVDEIELKASLIIIDGVLSTKHELSDNSMLDLIIDTEDTALKILLGELPMLDAYKKGHIKAEGNFAKVAALAILMNVTGDELGVL